MELKKLKAMAKGLSYAYKKGFKDAIDIYGFKENEEELNKILRDSQKKASNELCKKFSKEWNK